MRNTETALAYNNLRISFADSKGKTDAVHGASFEVGKGRILCLIGESGSGKTVSALAAVGMLPSGGKVEAGEIFFQGNDLLTVSRNDLSVIRGKCIFTVLQNPMSAFSSSIRVGDQLYSLACSHDFIKRQDFMRRMADIMSTLNFSEPVRVLESFSFQLSGGMLQRMLLAMAIYMEPQVLLADEPTTSLDAGIQKEFLALLKGIRNRMGVSVLLITHDFSVVSEVADDVAVMKDGEIVEKGSVYEVIGNPQHYYTRNLLQARMKMEGIG